MSHFDVNKKPCATPFHHRSLIAFHLSFIALFPLDSYHVPFVVNSTTHTMATKSEVSRKDIRDAISLLCEQTESKYVNLFNDGTLSNLDRPIGKERYIIATGSYAFGQWQLGDDVHLVIMAKASRALLWELIAEKLSLPPTILPTSSTIEISARTLARTTSLQPSVFGRFEVLGSKTMV